MSEAAPESILTLDTVELQTSQPKPDLGSQSKTVAENDDGSIEIEVVS